MSQGQAKTCHLCGTDVTHSERHKNRHGQYLCMKCLKTTKKHSWKKGLRDVGKKAMLIILYALLAAAVAWMFWHVLDVMNQPGEPGP